MPFVYKKFTELDQPKYDSAHLKNTLNTFRYPSRWVVDEERDAWMVSFGGRGSTPVEQGFPPNYFALVYQKQNIYFEGRFESTDSSFNKYKAQVWYTLDVYIPTKFMEQEDTIKTLIYESVKEYDINREYASEVMPIKFSTIKFIERS